MPDTNFNPLLQWSEALLAPDSEHPDARSGSDRRTRPGGLRASAPTQLRRRRSDVWTGEPQSPLTWDNLL